MGASGSQPTIPAFMSFGSPGLSDGIADFPFLLEPFQQVHFWPYVYAGAPNVTPEVNFRGLRGRPDRTIPAQAIVAAYHQGQPWAIEPMADLARYGY